MQERDKQAIEGIALALDSVSADLRLYDIWHTKGWFNINQGAVGTLERLAKDLAAIIAAVKEGT